MATYEAPGRARTSRPVSLPSTRGCVGRPGRSRWTAFALGTRSDPNCETPFVDRGCSHLTAIYAVNCEHPRAGPRRLGKPALGKATVAPDGANSVARDLPDVGRLEVEVDIAVGRRFGNSVIALRRLAEKILAVPSSLGRLQVVRMGVQKSAIERPHV